jgi:hypothetical protein
MLHVDIDIDNSTHGTVGIRDYGRKLREGAIGWY